MVAVPSTLSVSWAADTVTVCAVLQFVVLKVSDPPELTVTSESPWLCGVALTETLCVGWVSSTTV